MVVSLGHFVNIAWLEKVLVLGELPSDGPEGMLSLEQKMCLPDVGDYFPGAAIEGNSKRAEDDVERFKALYHPNPLRKTIMRGWEVMFVGMEMEDIDVSLFAACALCT